jgi:hypothetical protein
MGYTAVSMSIEGRRSSHNSIHDELDKVRWSHFQNKVKELAERPEYTELELNVYTSED